MSSINRKIYPQFFLPISKLTFDSMSRKSWWDKKSVNVKRWWGGLEDRNPYGVNNQLVVAAIIISCCGFYNFSCLNPIITANNSVLKMPVKKFEGSYVQTTRSFLRNPLIHVDSLTFTFVKNNRFIQNLLHLIGYRVLDRYISVLSNIMSFTICWSRYQSLFVWLESQQNLTRSWWH